MGAIASVPRGTLGGLRDVARAVVLVEGAARTEWMVQEWLGWQPLDERVVRLDVVSAADDAEASVGKEVVVAAPLRLWDEQVKWLVMAAGRAVKVEGERRAARLGRVIEVEDDWTRKLGEACEQSYWEVGGVLEERAEVAVLRAGPSGNRSAGVWEINGEQAYALQEGGEAWTVSSALRAVSALCGLDLILALVPSETAEAELTEDVDLGRGVREALTRVLNSHGLYLRRELWRQGGEVAERRAVRPRKMGRPVHVKLGDERGPGGVVRVEAEMAAEGSGGEGRVWLSGVWMGLGMGDRLMIGRRLGREGAELLPDAGAEIVELTRRWPERMGGGGGAGGETMARVAW